jgi:hypothetical protein
MMCGIQVQFKQQFPQVLAGRVAVKKSPSLELASLTLPSPT